MDHSTAYLMEFTGDKNTPVKTLQPATISQQLHPNTGIGEKGMHHKEQLHQTAYYKSLIAVIRNFDDVVLFGPTDAKLELLNVLRADNHYNKINIQVRQADKMTGNQQLAFVRDYFSLPQPPPVYERKKENQPINN